MADTEEEEVDGRSRTDGRAAHITLHRQVRVTRKCWHMRHSGTERENCVSCDKKTRDSNMKGGTCTCRADKPVRKSGVKRTKMEVDGIVDSKKKLDQRKRELVKQMRKIDEFTDVPQNVVDELKEKVATRTARYRAKTK